MKPDFDQDGRLRHDTDQLKLYDKEEDANGDLHPQHA